MSNSARHQIVRIIEDDCIGCTKCISACPVDAIVGASQTKHAVLTEFCIGCELCLPPCPVHCIEIIPSKAPLDTKVRADIAKERIQKRKSRLNKLADIKKQTDNHYLNIAQDEIAAALKRSKSRKAFIWSADEQDQS
ncbi:MAG: RnfABCDGE type electron transport complex subunit B [Candidatus Berkiella sp.]